MQNLGFGNGSAGPATLSGTDAPIDSSCSGSAATKSLTATNASFTEDAIILIHQSRGTGSGSWELNIIDSYTPGTITTLFDLANDYLDSGADQAQVIQVPEYSSVTITGTFTVKAWDGDTGGIGAFFSSGFINISGTYTAAGKGFRGGSGGSGNGQAGEGTTGAAATQTSANGSGGGGGSKGPDAGHVEGGHGGGGGNGAAGSSGIGKNTATPGAGGSSSGSSDGTSLTFGGGGGSGGANFSGLQSGTDGGPGGGIIFMWGNEMNITGSVNCDGVVGTGNNTAAGCGGGGAGGSIYAVCVKGVFGTNLMSAQGAVGGTSTGAFGGSGATGAKGRIVILSCDHTGSTLPAADEYKGDHEFCVVYGQIY